MTLKEVWGGFRNKHPSFKAAVYMGIASLTVFIHLLLNREPLNITSSAKEAYQVYGLDSTASIVALALDDRIREEILYRRPVWIIVVITARLYRLFPDYKAIKWLGYGLSAVVLVVLASRWAPGRRFFPVPIFCYGLVWGYLVFATRNLLYPIIFHAGSNSIALIGIMLISH